jgi:Zn-finger nucleic acid-binding protein
MALTCPACKADLKVSTFETEPAHRCPECDGMFLAHNVVMALVERHSVAAKGKAPPPAALPNAVEYRKCPSCSSQMARKNFARISGIMLDSCPPHGVWFDTGEVHGVLAFVAAGGLTHSRRLEDAARARRTDDPGLVEGDLTDVSWADIDSWDGSLD